jgi:hypothetical protein
MGGTTGNRKELIVWNGLRVMSKQTSSLAMQQFTIFAKYRWYYLQ